MKRPVRGFEMSKRFWIGLWKAAQLAPNLETLHLGLLTVGYCDFEAYGLFQALREGLKLGSFHADGQTHSSVGLELWYFFSKDKEAVEFSELTETKLQIYKDKKDRNPGKSWLLMQEDGLADELSTRLSAFFLNKGRLT
ncbi:uncharacterized protein EAF02_009552 [Botrytis sinoallii]|uniref:uncharacterized protein n=1 Tax=Botrytis sinoallii TaxID=1463999 RepID=UPI0019013018|nr:uncharacterized protein EAF02_009552 [Botrytis sinoallii]KAF7868816.1 hypothetical protein EAF02_009552 [Botrytis sinoallii]